MKLSNSGELFGPFLALSTLCAKCPSKLRTLPNLTYASQSLQGEKYTSTCITLNP